jgi:hypothetical protein
MLRKNLPQISKILQINSDAIFELRGKKCNKFKFFLNNIDLKWQTISFSADPK